MTVFAEAEALFGSHSRGDADRLSDRDILIVDSDLKRLNARRLDLVKQGYSVASYTWNKFSELSKRGALFIQHLKLESVILCDRDGRLRSILESYNPKSTYQAEIEQNAALASLVSSYPATDRGRLWVADVLYVCVRNFGVLHLASKRRYVFGFEAIIEELKDDGCLDEGHARALRQLRWMKSAYRGEWNLASSRIVSMLDDAIISIPSQILNAGCVARSAIDIIRASNSLGSDASPYHRLRNLERAYVALLEVGANSHCDELTLLRRWIENPRAYSGMAVTSERKLLQLFAGFAHSSGFKLAS